MVVVSLSGGTKRSGPGGQKWDEVSWVAGDEPIGSGYTGRGDLEVIGEDLD